MYFCKIRKITITLLSAAILFSPAADLFAQKTKGKQTNSVKTAPAKKGSGKSAPAKKESVSEVKRQQGDVQKEIATTRAQIKENEQAVKKGLADLNVLQGEISQGQKKLADATNQVKELTEKIGFVEKDIAKEEGELKRLRDEYLKAVKKMRIKRKSASKLSFIFSSKSFSEAMRRMRYLREFSSWREGQNKKISDKVSKLKEQKDLLAKTKSEKNVALQEESRLQAKLQGQYKEQDAMVATLKANGDALRKYLAQKQSEANALKAKVSALIAEEQRKAEEQRRAREEAARKAEQQRKEQLAREEAARKAAEAKAQKEREIAAAEAKAKEKARQDEEAKRKAQAEADKKKKAEEKKKAAPKETPKKETSKKENKKEDNSSGSKYAEARKRRPRGQKDQATDKPSKGAEKPVPAVSTGENVNKGNGGAKKAAESAATGFAQMKGSLPRPVSGSFRITSRFGRHSLPDLPNVMYDNPGIDAEVSAGANAQAVYEGKVSGVYMVPGYSTVVIINHGNYYTVYGNIQSAAVKVGDSVKQGHNLGKLGPSDDDSSHSSIHFEVWHNRDKMNPSEWIR
ncbi:MAG: peptidoglycan DD-metalloendopeptidase family protein [Muribaculaceae bacterium]|nr:peptidoglycan DD-metalloendopeptidase family protein [Muribaculaceae bacterium]